MVVMEGGGRMGGRARMGVEAAPALHDGMRVPMSSQFIRSKYLCCLMENLYTKVNDVCMHEYMHACILTCMHAYRAFFVFLKFQCDCLYGYSLHWPSPHPAQRVVKRSLDQPNPSLGLNPNVG